MGYWKSKVLPKIKKAFDKNGAKKAAAAEACKSFGDSKVEMDKEFEEKKTELQPKVAEIYEAAPAEIKTLVKERREEGVKRHPAAVTKFLEELANINFPGAKKVSEATSAFGPALVSGPVLFVLEKVSSFVATEEAAATPESSSSKEKEVAVEVAGREKKEKEVEKAEEEATTTVVVAAAAAAAEEIKLPEAPEAPETQAPAEEPAAKAAEGEAAAPKA